MFHVEKVKMNGLAKTILMLVAVMALCVMSTPVIAAGLIENNSTGTLMCLGISGPVQAGAPVTTVNCNNNAPLWMPLLDGRIQYGTGSEDQSFCLDADSNHPANWNKAQIWNCSGTIVNQKWNWTGNSTIQFVTNSLCVTPNTLGQQLILSQCNPQTQTWTLVSPTVPTAPAITAVVASFTEAAVGFNPPSSNGGMQITQYIVTASVAGSVVQTRTGASSPIYVSGLKNDVPTIFTVTAVNPVGTGPASPGFNSSMASWCYGAPTGPYGCAPRYPSTITSVTPGDQQVIVAFTAIDPMYSGGSPIVSYTATSTPGDISVTQAQGPITVTGLTNGTSYTFTIIATNADKWGIMSSPSQSVTPEPTGKSKK